MCFEKNLTPSYTQELRVTSSSSKARDMVLRKLSSVSAAVKAVSDALLSSEARTAAAVVASERSLAAGLSRLEERHCAALAERVGAAEVAIRRSIRRAAISAAAQIGQRPNGLAPVGRRTSAGHLRLGRPSPRAAAAPTPHSTFGAPGAGASGKREGGTASFARLRPQVVLSGVRSLLEERQHDGRVDYLEYWFGICRPMDAMTGPNDEKRKTGCTVIHPASRVNIGPQSASSSAAYVLIL